MFPFRMYSLSELEEVRIGMRGEELCSPDDDSKSIMLAIVGSEDEKSKQYYGDIPYETAVPKLLTEYNEDKSIIVVSRKECLEVLDSAFDHMPFEKEITAVFRVCGACSGALKGPICTHCRCRQCTAWKTKCQCYLRPTNRKNIFAWMKRGYYQYTKEQASAPIFHCILCKAQLTSLTAPYLRCLDCVAKTI